MQVEKIMEENYDAGYRGRPRKPVRIVEPSTPIPRRASAYPENIVKIRPKYVYIGSRDDGSAGGPLHRETVVWQHESVHYCVESSLPALSLMQPEAYIPIDERDTVPPGREREEPDICERATVPPVLARLLLVLEGYEAQRLAAQSSVVEINTVPSEALVLSQISMYSPDVKEDSVQGQSMPLPDVYNDELWQEQFPLTLYPLERMRGWLLGPGHLELLLWLLGTLLLMCVTGGIVYAVMVSLGR